MEEKVQKYADVFDEFARVQKEPLWLRDARVKAFDHFKERGFPRRKDENWRFTNISPIVDGEFYPSVQKPAVPVLSKDALKLINRLSPCAVFLNGHFSKEHSSLSDLPGHVQVGDLFSEMRNKNPVLQNYLSTQASDDAFASLNKAFAGEGVFVQAGANTHFAQPIHILHFHEGLPTQDQKNVSTLVSPRTFISISRGASVTVLESYVSFQGETYFTNAVTDIQLEEGATLNWCRLQAESEQAFHVGTVRALLKKDSFLDAFDLSCGAKIGRNNFDVVLAGEGASTFLNGLYVTRHHQLIDNHTCVDHASAHTMSRQLYKGLLHDNSRAVFNGKVIVRQNSQLIDSAQLNKNLLLSDSAQIHTKPQLEIAANDVKCTHGATVGQINPEDVFYLRSRGIPDALARELLIGAFVSEVVNTLKDHNLRTLLKEFICL